MKAKDKRKSKETNAQPVAAETERKKAQTEGLDLELEVLQERVAPYGMWSRA